MTTSPPTPGDSHGEILRRFTLDPANRDADYLLFLDADVCFTRPHTLATLASTLRQHPDASGAGPRMSWDGETKMPPGPSDNPGINVRRLHPGCALVVNTPIFRSVAEEVGLSCVRMLQAGQDEYLDTFELMTRVMRTHGQRHVIADEALIMHAFAVSYLDASRPLLPEKEARRDRWLTVMRRRDQF